MRVDSDDVTETTVEVEVPGDPVGQLAQLVEIAHARYPDAEFRSFADGAASFLAVKLLVVVAYQRASTTDIGSPPRGAFQRVLP